MPNSRSATHFAMDSGSFYMLMFAIFGKNVHYFYTSIYQLSYIVGFGFFIILAKFGKKFIIFQKWKPKPTIKCNKEYYKNTAQVLPYLDMLGLM